MAVQQTDLIGFVRGRLKVVSFSHVNNSGRGVWNCACSCGKLLKLRRDTIISAYRKSCGCLKLEGCGRGQENKNWKGYKEISLSLYNRLKRDAAKRKLAFDVSIEDLWELFIKQDRCCALSHVSIKFANCKLSKETTASLDRIDSQHGYVKGNLQWVHKLVNIMKWDLPLPIFLDFADKISKHALVIQRKNVCLPSRMSSVRSRSSAPL